MSVELMKLESPLITQKYTKVEHEKKTVLGAPYYFIVRNVEDNSVLAEVNFQKGPIKESGVNGIMNEDLIAMIIKRLEGFQNTEFWCRENARAIEKLEEALMWLRKRTTSREMRGVEGTHSV